MGLILETAKGPVILRPEQPSDADFLYTLFRGRMLPDLAALPLDDGARETLIRMQFDAQTKGYRARFPDARFDVVHSHGVPIGRLIVDQTQDAGCIVDFALLPAARRGGLGTAILGAVLAGMATTVRCKVIWNNTPSLRMCQRLGFVQTGGDLPFLQLEWYPSWRT